jgi:hypothetical protein
MTTRNVLKQLGGTTILFGALALAPLTASAMMAKPGVDSPASTANMGAEATFHAKPSSQGETLVPRVGYVNTNSSHAKAHPRTSSKSHGADLVLVPKVGYVNVKAIS